MKTWCVEKTSPAVFNNILEMNLVYNIFSINSLLCLFLVIPSFFPIERRKNPLTFHCTGCLIGILTYPYHSLSLSLSKSAEFHPLYTTPKTNMIHYMMMENPSWMKMYFLSKIGKFPIFRGENPTNQGPFFHCSKPPSFEKKNKSLFVEATGSR